MECPKCRYALSAFDVNCPRCKNFADLGLPVPNLSATASSLDNNSAPSTVETIGLPEPAESEKAWYSKLDLMDAKPATEDAAPAVQENLPPIISSTPQFQSLSSQLAVSKPIPKAIFIPSPAPNNARPGGDAVSRPAVISAAPAPIRGKADSIRIFAAISFAAAVGAVWFVVHPKTVSREQQAKSSWINASHNPVAQADIKAQAAGVLVSEVATSIAYDKTLTLTDQQAAILRTGLRAKCRSALADCAQALQADPSNAAALAARVRALRYLGDAKSADISLSNALKTCPDNPVLLDLEKRHK